MNWSDSLNIEMDTDSVVMMTSVRYIIVPIFVVEIFDFFSLIVLLVGLYQE